MTSIARACAALALLAACAAQPAASAPPVPSSPSLMWRDLRAVGVMCLVQSSPEIDSRSLETALCDRIVSMVADGAPVPVRRVTPGDPAILADGAVTLLVHASVDKVGGRSALSFAVRPIRPSAPDAEIYFGAAPRTADLGRGADLGVSLAPALSSALAELLPWKLQVGPVRVLTEIH